MKLAIDSNQIIAAFIKNSASRKVLLSKSFEFYAPEQTVDEIRKYQDYIIEKARLNSGEFSLLYAQLFDSIQVISIAQIQQDLPIAEQIMNKVDPKEKWFLAVGMAVKAEGIWTNDKHFQSQKILPIYSTSKLLGILLEIVKKE